MLADISPEFDECPLVCFKKEGNGEDFCKSCDVKVAREIFQEEAIQVLDERFGDEWKIYPFDEILKSVISIINSEDDNKMTWSPTTDLLFDVYISQRTRLKRIDDWNYKQKIKRQENGY